MMKYYKTQVGADTILVGEMTLPDILGNETICKGESNLSQIEGELRAGNTTLLGFSFGGALKKLKKVGKNIDPVKLVKNAPKIAEAIGKKEVLDKALKVAKLTPAGQKLGLAMALVNSVKAGSPQAKKTVIEIDRKAKEGNEVAKTDAAAIKVAKDLSDQVEAHNEEVDQERKERSERNAAVFRSRYMHGVRAGIPT